MNKIEFKDERISTHWAYGDFYCEVPNSDIKILLPYSGEPPHGDSFHKIIIDSKTTRGYAWSGYFLWSECGNFFTCDWLEGMDGYLENKSWVFTQSLRATIIVEPRKLRYRIIISPSHNELHKILTEQGQAKLWDVLLSTKDAQWENFNSLATPFLDNALEASAITRQGSKQTYMQLTLKKIGDATLIAPLAAIPISIIFWTMFGIPKNTYGDGYYYTYILVSAIAVIVAYPSLFVFGTIPMLIYRKTDGLNIGVICLVITLVALILSMFDDSNRQYFFLFLSLYMNSVAIAFWYVLTYRHKTI